MEKKTNINILGQSFRENYKPKYIYSTSFELILINLQNYQFLSKFAYACGYNTRVLKDPSKN